MVQVEGGTVPDTSEGSEQAFTRLIASAEPGVRELALRARRGPRGGLRRCGGGGPDGEAPGFTFIPGT